MVYDGIGDWTGAFDTTGSPPTFMEFAEVLVDRNSKDHPTASRLPRTGKSSENIKVTTSDHTNVAADLLVDYGLRLDKNGQLHPHGWRINCGLTTKKIKVEIQTGREKCCAISRRSFTVLAEETYRKNR